MINENQKVTVSQPLPFHELPRKKARNCLSDVGVHENSPRRGIKSFKINGFDNNEFVLQLITKYNHNHQPSSSTIERTLGTSPKKETPGIDSLRRNLKVTFADQIAREQPLATIIDVESYKQYYSNFEDSRSHTTKALFDCCTCLLI